MTRILKFVVGFVLFFLIVVTFFQCELIYQSRHANKATVTNPKIGIKKKNFFFMLHIILGQQSDLFHVTLPQGPRLI